MNKCTRCLETRDDTSIHCRKVNKDGSVYTRYICRPCRNQRWHKQHPQNTTKVPQQVITLPPENPEHRNFYLNPQTKWKRVNVVEPVKIKYTAPQEEIVRLGMEKNLAIMRKYA